MNLLRLSLVLVAAGSSNLVRADWLDDFNRNCIARGGTPVHNPGGGGYCRPGPASGSGAAGANPYGAMANSFADLLNQIDAANDAAAKQKRAAVMQALENERQDALRRQETARAANLAAIQQRLMNNELGLKGSGNELQLKLGSGAQPETKPAEYGLPGRHVFRNDIFVQGAAPTPTERIASSLLTLKIGDDATESLRNDRPSTAPPNASDNGKSATGAIAPKADEVAALFNRLSPEEQRRIIEAAGANVQAPNATPASAPMSLKLSAARESADRTRAEANANDAPLESLKARGEDDLRTGGAALRDLQPRRSQPSQAPSSPPPSPPPPAAPTPPAVATSSATAKAPAAAPKETARIQAPVPGDSGLLFGDLTNPAPPRITEDRDLLQQFQHESTPVARKRAEDARVAMMGLALMPDDPIAGGFRAGERQRRALVAHFAPELMQRYEDDPRLAANVDLMIDLRVAQARNWRSEADRAAQQVLAADEARKVQRENADRARLMLQESLRRDFESFKK